MKRILSGILSLMMVFSLTPTKIAFAENNNTENVTQSEESNGSGSQGIEQEGTSKIDYSQIAVVNASSEVNGNGDSQDAQSNSSELTGEAKTSENDDEENLNHTHTLSSDSTVINKNTLVRKCTNSDCDYYEIIAKFTAEDMNFTGNEYDESSLLTLWKKDASMKEDRITYTSSDGKGYSSSTPPTDVGKYVATAKVDDVANGWYELNADFEIKNTISPSSNTVTITKGGTYSIEGGEYTSNESAIVVNATEDVTLNILGDTEYNVTQDSDVSFIDIQNTGEVIINASQDNTDYKISSSTSLKLISINASANVTVNGGIYEYRQYAIYESESLTNNNNVLTLNGCEIIDSTWSESVGAKNIKLKNCHFLGIPFCNIFVYENGNVTFEGENELSCNEGVINVFLATNATLTLKDDFKNTNGNDLEIGVLNLLTVGDSRQITKDTSETLMSKIVSSDGYVVTKKNGNVYFWNHSHSYVPELSESNDSLIAKCENSDCNSSIVLATLNAVNTDFTSKSYGGVSVTLKEDYEDSITKDDIEYKEKDAADTEYSTTAPTQVGKYTASVTLTYDSKDYTLIKDFEITNTISSPSYNTVTITKGGTYNIEGGN